MTNDPQPSTGQREEPPARYQGYPPWPPDDEISLFDLWDALVRRRWLILGVTALVTVLAVGYALAWPDVYRYSQVIEIGERMAGNSSSRSRHPTRPPRS